MSLSLYSFLRNSSTIESKKTAFWLDSTHKKLIHSGRRAHVCYSDWQFILITCPCEVDDGKGAEGGLWSGRDFRFQVVSIVYRLQGKPEKSCLSASFSHKKMPKLLSQEDRESRDEPRKE